MQRRSSKTVTRAAILAVASAFLTGCFTLEATFTIKDDATADVDYLVLIDTKQFEKFAGMLGEDTGDLEGLSGDALIEEFFGGDDPCQELTEEFTDYEISTREIAENGETGLGCTVTGVPIAELNSLGDDTSSFTIEQDADGTRFTAVLEGVDELAGDPSETDMLTSMLGVALDDLFTIRFVVTAPGSLGSNNATSTDGSTATWDIKPNSDFVTGSDATMTAEWTPGGGDSGSTIWIILAVLALAAVAAIAFVLVKRSKGSTPDSADTSPTSPTPEAMMSPSPPAGMAPPLGASAPPAPSVAPPPPLASEPPTAPPPASHPPTAPAPTSQPPTTPPPASPPPMAPPPPPAS